MKNEKFKIANHIKELIVRIDDNLVNFPKKEIELKRKIKETSYDLLYVMYRANVTSNMELKKELGETAIAQIKYLDFLINLCYDKQIINAKKYVKFGESLNDIVRYIMAWLANLNK